MSGESAPDLPVAQGSPEDDVPQKAIEELSESEDLSGPEAGLYEALNNARERYGLAGVTRSSDLDEVARGHSREMAETGVVAHDSPKTGGPADRVRAAAIPFVKVTENLAMAQNVLGAHTGLMESPGHKANILDRDVLEVGIGAAKGKSGESDVIYFTQVFMIRVEKLKPKKARRALYRELSHLRREQGVSKLKPDSTLEKAAKKSLGSCFNDGSLRTDVLSTNKFAEVAAAGVLGGSVKDIGELLRGTPAASKDGYDSVGIALTQGDHPELGNNIICLRLILGKRL